MTRLELFYDLVFVYAFLRVTTVTSKHLTVTVLLGGLLVLAVLWFAWTAFVMLGNVIRADQGVMPLVGFVIMAVVFVAALTVPEVFTVVPGGLHGDVIFALCYFLVRALEVLTLWYASRDDGELRPRWSAFVVPPLVSTALLLVAATVPQRLFAGTAEFGARAGLWVLAIVVAYLRGVFVVRTQGLTIVSAGHWAERYAQIVLIALGESIISLGTGPNLAAGLPLTWPIIGATMLGIIVIAALWLAYFDSLAIAAEQALHRAQGAARVALARDAYTYLHLPMIAGIILFSLGLKRTLAEIADPAGPSSQDSLDGIDLYVLYGGVILYTLALLGVQLRTVRRAGWFKITLVVLLAALIPVAERLPALAALALLVLVAVGLVVMQTCCVKHPRQQLRRSALEEQQALEAEETEWRRRHP